MITTRRSSIAGIAVAAALALTLGGCGGSASPKSAPGGRTPSTAPAKTPVNVLLASVRTTAAAKTALVSMSVATDGSGPMAFTMTGEGAMDFETGNSRFTMNVGGGAASLLPGGIEARVVDGVMYMKMPPIFGFGGDKWYSIKTRGLAGGVGSGGLGNLGSSDPASYLSALGNVSDDAKDLGPATVRGTQTEHYSATVDFGKTLDNPEIPKGLREKAKGLFGKLSAIKVPVDVFVDRDGRVRRMSMTIDMNDIIGAMGASGASGLSGVTLPTMTATIDLHDFGAPVSVVAPPADQVVEFPTAGDLGGLGMNGLGASGGLGGTPTAAPPTKVS
jgi:hypothetical protein